MMKLIILTLAAAGLVLGFASSCPIKAPQKDTPGDIAFKNNQDKQEAALPPEEGIFRGLMSQI